MEQAIAAIVAALITGLVALMTLWLSTRYQDRSFERQRILENDREREKKKIQYLDPLLISASDLLAKIKRLEEEMHTTEGRVFWQDAFKRVKDWNRDTEENKIEFAYRLNGYDAGPAITLYITCIYFARASKIRLELPFIQLTPQNDQCLLDHLSRVRSAFGGEQNLWEELQDSLGSYVTGKDGSIMTYKEFCEQLIDQQAYIWLLRLIDFYRDAHLKLDVEIPRIIRSLDDLISFAKKMSQVEPG